MNRFSLFHHPTTDYYPYGLPHATATNQPDYSDPRTNRRLYSAKELTAEAGLNAYDFHARSLSPSFPRFTTPDPLATDYTPISPYTFCASLYNLIGIKNFSSKRSHYF